MHCSSSLLIAVSPHCSIWQFWTGVFCWVAWCKHRLGSWCGWLTRCSLALAQRCPCSWWIGSLLRQPAICCDQARKEDQRQGLPLFGRCHSVKSYSLTACSFECLQNCPISTKCRFHCFLFVRQESLSDPLRWASRFGWKVAGLCGWLSSSCSEERTQSWCHPWRQLCWGNAFGWNTCYSFGYQGPRLAS